MRTLIITSCTGEKKYHPENQLTWDDFKDPIRLSKREAELSEYKVPAKEMYEGTQHLRLMEGIDILRKNIGSDVLDLYIVSAGYGLINENKEIVPYEVTFNSMSTKEIKDWSTKLNIHGKLTSIIPNYDLIILLLGDKYLKAVQLPLENITKDQKVIMLAGAICKKAVPNNSSYYLIESGKEEAMTYSYGIIGLKGFLFKLLAQEIINGNISFEDIHRQPELLMKSLEKYKK